jgi:hypothetical protein
MGLKCPIGLAISKGWVGKCLFSGMTVGVTGNLTTQMCANPPNYHGIIRQPFIWVLFLISPG